MRNPCCWIHERPYSRESNKEQLAPKCVKKEYLDKMQGDDKLIKYGDGLRRDCRTHEPLLDRGLMSEESELALANGDIEIEVITQESMKA